MVSMRKKFIITVAVLVLLALSAQFVHARFTLREGDMVVQDAAALDVVATRLLLAANAAATSTGLVDVSASSPHAIPNATAEVSQLQFEHFSNGIATTTLKVGVLASTTAAGGNVDVYWFADVTLVSEGSQSTADRAVLDYSPAYLNTALSSGAPSKFETNDSSLYTADFATTSPLLYPSGSYVAPAVGDLVLRVYDQKGTATTSVTTLYRSREQ